MVWWGIICVWVGIMTGALALFREWMLIFHPQKANERKLFWASVRVAFLLSAGMAWFAEHERVLALATEIGAQRQTVKDLNARVTNSQYQIDERQGELNKLQGDINRLRANSSSAPHEPDTKTVTTGPSSNVRVTPPAKTTRSVSASKARAEPPLTLRSLFEERDFTNFYRSRADGKIKNKDGTETTIEVQTYSDFLAKAKFLGLFIPHCDLTPRSDKTYEICEYFADHYGDALALSNPVPMAGFLSEMTKAEDLMFTGRVYVYHEDYLTPEQIVALRALYRKKNLEAWFRGVDYWMFKSTAARRK